MKNNEKYKKNFYETSLYQLTPKILKDSIEYNEIPSGIHIGHMTLISALEEVFKSA